MPPAVGAAVGIGAALYGGRQSRKAAEAQANVANRAIDESLTPRRTQYGSYVGPYSGLVPSAPRVGGGGIFNRVLGRVMPGQGGDGISNPGDKFTYLDPSIRDMRERTLANIPTYQGILNPQLSSTLSGLGQTRNELSRLYGDAENTFLNPVLQNLALQRGQLTRGLTQRGLGGSSFYSQALGNFESAAAPGIARAALDGRRSLLSDMANIDTQKLAAASAGVADLQNLDNIYSTIAGQNLQQELSALGLSQADISGLVQAGQLLGNAGQLKAQAFGNTLGAIGDLLPMFGQKKTPGLGEGTDWGRMIGLG